MSISDLWARLEVAATACGGSLVPLAADLTIRLYDSPSDPARAAALSPPLDLVVARQPPAYAELIAAHGYVAVDVPHRRLAFVFLPPPAVAQMTRATGEPDRNWTDVVNERLTGRSTFGWLPFAAWELADVNGWALSPEGQVWAVEDSLPFEEVGSFETWLAERIAALETAATERGPHGSDDDRDAADDDDGDDDRFSILDEL